MTEPFNPAQSILGGARERAFSERFNGDLTLVAAGYNAGPGAAEKYRACRLTRRQDYIAKVLAMYERYKYGLAQAGRPQGVFGHYAGQQLAIAPPVPRRRSCHQTTDLGSQTSIGKTRLEQYREKKEPPKRAAPVRLRVSTSAGQPRRPTVLSSRVEEGSFTP